MRKKEEIIPLPCPSAAGKGMLRRKSMGETPGVHMARDGQNSDSGMPDCLAMLFITPVFTKPFIP